MIADPDRAVALPPLVPSYSVSTQALPYGGITTLDLRGDDEIAPVVFPFPVQFYGTSYSVGWVDTNGQVSFADHTFWNVSFCELVCVGVTGNEEGLYLEVGGWVVAGRHCRWEVPLSLHLSFRLAPATVKHAFPGVWVYADPGRQDQMVR